jgi:hypothetical protein
MSSRREGRRQLFVELRSDTSGSNALACMRPPLEPNRSIIDDCSPKSESKGTQNRQNRKFFKLLERNL